MKIFYLFNVTNEKFFLMIQNNKNVKKFHSPLISIFEAWYEYFAFELILEHSISNCLPNMTFIRALYQPIKNSNSSNHASEHPHFEIGAFLDQYSYTTSNHRSPYVL